MRFGPIPPKHLPQQDSAKVLLLAERWQRAAYAHQRWAAEAKRATDFVEGRQWTEEQIAEMKAQKRPFFKFNIISPIVRLVIGYQGQNKLETVFKPAHDTASNDATAEALTKVSKAVDVENESEYVDAEVFLDGVIGGRGWYNLDLCWENNDFGEVKIAAADPFATYIDPDADSYDINESASFMQTSKMVSVDEVEAALGKPVSELIRPWTLGQTPFAPVSSLVVNDEITPVRYFGAREDWQDEYWDQFYTLMGDFTDRHRKTVRAIETQYKVREPRNVMIDLETGDKRVLPANWTAEKIQKALLYAEYVGNPCVVQRRLVERIHWTTMIADLIVYDAPSLFDSYTQVGFFPYFRRGVTRGMVDDLIDPQLEKNKSRNARIEIESRTANGGWMHHVDALDPVQERVLDKFGSRPGVRVKWKGEKEPRQIEPSSPALSYERLERQSDEDIRRISGINESALGEIDKVQSGIAIQSRQRQAVISVQMYMDNFRRSKRLLGKKKLNLIQNFYTEERLYRVTGDDGKEEQVVLNQVLMDPASGGKRIINDVSMGKYSVVVDETPLSVTFQAAQFDEMMSILEKIGPALGGALPALSDLIIGMSSMPRKEEWIARLQALMGAQAAAQAAAPAAEGGGQPQGQVPGPPAPAALPAPAGV